MLAKDAAGNTGEGRGHITLKIDNYRPKPTQIIAASSLDPKTLGKQPTITVKLDEQGCGLHDRQVFITSAAFGRRRANECVHEGGSQWVCSFSGFTISDSHHGSTADVSVTQDSRDECANRVEGDRKESFFIDTKKPVINSINVTNNAKELFIKEGDSLIVKLDISDDSDMVYVSGNFSRVTEGQDVVKGTCKKQGNFTCTITVSGLKASSEDVTIIIQDKANNTERATIRINIYGRDEREDTDFWIAANEKVSPEMIDRSLAAKTTMRVFANFDLRARNERQALVSIKNLKCQGEEVKIQKTDLLFTPDRSPGTKSIAIYMELSRQNIQVNSDVVTCTMDLVTFTGDAITTSPEKETVELELTFYDGFLGVSGDNAYDKIKRRGEFLKDADWAAGLLKGYNVFEKACAGFTTLTIGVETFNILALADIELISGVMLTGIAEGLNELVGEAAIKFGREVCNIISCKNLYPIPGFDEQGLRGIIWGQETCREATKDIEWLNFLEEEDNIKDNTITVRCPDPKNNLISAALYGCWPYVITGVQKMMVIEAMTLDCYLNSIESGLPIYHCDNMHSQLYCEWILGDFFEIIPQAQAIGKIRDMALNVLEDPISMAVTLFSLISPKLPETSIGTLTIMVTEFTDSIFKATRLFEEIKSYAVGETDMDYVTKVTTRYEKTIDSR